MSTLTLPEKFLYKTVYDRLKKLHKKKIYFQYQSQENKYVPFKISSDVKVIGDFDAVEGTVYRDAVKECQNGNFVITMKNMNRRKVSPLGEGHNPKVKKNAPLWRSYRFEGIDFKTAMVKDHGKLVPLFKA